LANVIWRTDLRIKHTQTRRH